MLHPSYTELMQYINKDVENGEEPVITSRYSIVIATAKRARQIIEEGDNSAVTVKEAAKPLSTAVKELYEGKIKILSEDTGADEILEIDDLGEEEEILTIEE